MTALTGKGLRLLDTGSLEGLTILGSGSEAGPELGLLDIAPEYAILVSLPILALGSSCQLTGLSWAPWVKNPV